MVAGLLPFIGVGLVGLNGYRAASRDAEQTTAQALDEASSATLLERTQQTAGALGAFLDERADDTRMVALMPFDPVILSHFAARTEPLWYVTGTRARPVEYRDPFPLYREVLMLDSTGRVVVRTVDGKLVSDPGDSTRAATYFATAKTLAPNALSVSHLSRRYLPEPVDEATQLPGKDFITFDGVYRFIAARRTVDGTFDGAVMLALDARFVMEFTNHIISTHANQEVVWADFASGDYSYLLDDEGYYIAHPQLWAVRGDDANGQPVPAARSQGELKDHPLNDAQAGWIDPNRPRLFASGLGGMSGTAQATNALGVTSVKTYAPIPFAEGTYRDRGVFGVVVIGASLAEFHAAASTVQAHVDAHRQQFAWQMALVASVGLLLSVLIAVIVSRLLVRPLRTLTAAAKKLKDGVLDEEPLQAIHRRPFDDEVTVLADVFIDMGRQIMRREQQMRSEITELRITIDSRRRQEQTEEITGTDYFQNLQQTASRIRARRADEPAPPDGTT
jgi:hypothetical protein